MTTTTGRGIADEVETGMNPSYVGAREDLAALIPTDVTRLLDVGCSIGALGAHLKKQRSGIEVHGIEADHEMARCAAEVLDTVVRANVEELSLEAIGSEAYFDCIVFGDVLEHLVDPWSILQRAVTRLRGGGTVIISVPNVRHFTTLVNLLVWGTWPLRDRGLFDRTHLRWFTLRSLRELCTGSGLRVVDVRRKYRLFDRPVRLNRFARLLALPPIRDFLAYQYVVTARKPSERA